MPGFDGNLEQARLTAGQCVGNIDAVLPAAEFVRRMNDEALDVLTRFGAEVSTN
jgi:NAD(P)H-dependent flavin oxidoreductase YrpB (nitropropane dioxygenase family)